MKTARGVTGPERLAKIEATGDPPRSVLLQMAKKYRRPLLIFYLNQPPRTGDRGQDFRTLPGEDRRNPELDALIRDIRSRQGLVRSVLEDEEAERPGFVGAATMEMPVAVLADRMVEKLNFSLNAFRGEKTANDPFGYLRAQIEAAGVFVLLLGNLGSHHSNIPLEFFRGFAIADPLAPMIVINDQDARTAWSFTALHELVHIWLGTTGISGRDAGAQIERYCNDVAGEILVPAPELAALARLSGFERMAAAISDFAEARRVSRSMVAYKLFRRGRISRTVWERLDAHFRKEWLAVKERKAEQQRASEGGPSYYVVKRHRVGEALLALMRRALDEGAITYTKAGRVLGVKPTNVQPLLGHGPTRGLR
ncbi:MAG TPA: ImmA/IrrE family metallo-endopeptidase [Terriglobia bacterium]|nr:ImmA/IrrE family metallo-endopeptidase [Terriglobia bacterium]